MGNIWELRRRNINIWILLLSKSLIQSGVHLENFWLRTLSSNWWFTFSTRSCLLIIQFTSKKMRLTYVSRYVKRYHIALFTSVVYNPSVMHNFLYLTVWHRGCSEVFLLTCPEASCSVAFYQGRVFAALVDVKICCWFRIAK